MEHNDKEKAFLTLDIQRGKRQYRSRMTLQALPLIELQFPETALQVAAIAEGTELLRSDQTAGAAPRGLKTKGSNP